MNIAAGTRTPDSFEELAHISMGQASEQPARSLDLAEKPTAPLGATTSSKVNDQHELLF